MVRILGLGFARRTTKRRLNDSARTPEGMRDRHPLFEYALKEYTQTVVAGSSNDDGQHQQREHQRNQELHPQSLAPGTHNNAGAACQSSQQQQIQQIQQQQQQNPQRNQYVAPNIMPPSLVSSARQYNNHEIQQIPHNQRQQQQQQQHPSGLPPAAAPTTTTSTQQQQRHYVSPSLMAGLSPSDNELTSRGGGGGDGHGQMTARASSTGPHSRRGRSSFSESHSTVSGTTVTTGHLGHTTSTNTTIERMSSWQAAEPAMLRDDTTTTTELEHVSSTTSTSPPHDYLNNNNNSPFEEGMASAILYEEWYGDAYTGAPIKYIYPKGYQSMRPRSGPWRLSILICLCFTWLSVFVVGHCSDKVLNAELYNAMNAIDDDTVLIDIRWCGSRPYYFMWLASMLITGLSAAYCGVIGYIKCRDFAVANARAQPAMVGAMVTSSTTTTNTMTTPAGGKELPPQDSDYYLSLGGGGGGAVVSGNGNDDQEYYYSQVYDSHHPQQQQHHYWYSAGAGTATVSSVASPTFVTQQQQQQNLQQQLQQHLPPPPPSHRSIYQADGTPQFWGSQIYRPNQAAVAVTSR